MIIKFNPYLSFQGECEKAFNFYKTIFGGDFTKLIRFNDSQNEPGASAPPAEFGDYIRHIELPLNNDTIMMGSDVPEISGRKVNIGNNVKINITTDNNEEGLRLFKALSNEGTVKVKYGDSYWGSVYGSLIDKFGVHWLIEVRDDKAVAQGFEDNANIHIP